MGRVRTDDGTIRARVASTNGGPDALSGCPSVGRYLVRRALFTRQMPSVSRRDWLSVGRIVLTLLLVVAGIGLAPVADGQSAAQPETDNTVTRIHLESDGSGTWVVQIRTRLATDQAVREYEAFRSAVASNRSILLDPFRTRMTGVVGQAANITGREMEASDFSVETSIQEVPRRWGVVTYRFTWTGFARVEGDRLVVGDVFDAGFFLAEDDVLEVVAPDGYRITDIAPTPASQAQGTVGWVGREDFADGRPTVTVAPERGGTTTAATGAADDTNVPGTQGPLPLAPLAVVGIVVLVGGLAYLVVRTRRGPATTTDPLATADSDGQPRRDDESGPPPADIMTDEERVEETLQAHGGRMRQAEIAEALDWSTSKTSRVLSGMAESGRVEKLQLGRENVIDLADTEE